MVGTPRKPRAHAVSPAIQFLSLVWGRGANRSWECVNHGMSAALALAIDVGLTFDPSDWADMYGVHKWRPSYWRHTEDCYTLAIAVENQSAIDTIEQSLERTAIIADDVSFRCQTHTLHGDSITRAKCRLCVGATFTFGEHRPTVTSFSGDFDGGETTVVACTYKPRGDGEYRNKIAKRFTITRDDILADRAARKAAAKVNAKLKKGARR